MSYSNGTKQCLNYSADLTGAAAVDFKLASPLPGQTGRLVSISAVYTTGVTVAASSIRVGTSGDPDAYGSLACAIAATDTVVNAMTRGVTDRIPADSVVEVSNAGGATAGVAAVTIEIEWA